MTILARRSHSLRSWRAERFGGILQLERPRALVFVDRAYARSLGRHGGRLWADPETDGQVGLTPLSAPLEAHLQLTNRCDAGCAGCYTASSPNAPMGLGPEAWKRAIDVLAEAGVFHLALGGGESAHVAWLGEVAAHARRRGLLPNLTTSGLFGLDAVLEEARQLAQINVSMDGIRDVYAAVRGFDGFAQADAAVRALRDRKREVGLNVVVTRRNFATLGDIFAYARRRRLREVELLRFKPAGRGQTAYASLACTDEQNRSFLPMVLALARRYRVRVRVDCSFTPMIAWHEPDPAILGQLCVYGCTGGDFLVGATFTGLVTACSFAPPPQGQPHIIDLLEYWRREDAFGPFRRWHEAVAPCTGCRYHHLCRGGCRAVSAHLEGDASVPDPECPRVADTRRAHGLHVLGA